MKIFVTGTRGIPDIPGGVEKHCQELYPLIAKAGASVILATRSAYVTQSSDRFKGVKLTKLYAPRVKGLEAIVHTLLALLKARQVKADIVHIHAIGPSLLAPVAKLLGLTLVMTHHGQDYHRMKWGKSAKLMLKLGEFLGGRYADEVIVISDVIRKVVIRRCNRIPRLIYNGVPLPAPSCRDSFIRERGLVPGQYILAVSRFVPEKGLDLLVDAFESFLPEYPLVLAGDADHETDYSQSIKQRIDNNPKIFRTGYLTGSPLTQLFSHARLFVLPSFHEGLPIALLEALSFGLDVVVSDIPANREVGLPKTCYFKSGDRNDLKIKIEAALSRPLSMERKNNHRHFVQKKYNWQAIADQTMQVYLNAMSSQTSKKNPSKGKPKSQ